MNDFKEYSAAFQDHQNDLMHYGVKGMKWRHHDRRQYMEEINGLRNQHRTGSFERVADKVSDDRGRDRSARAAIINKNVETSGDFATKRFGRGVDVTNYYGGKDIKTVIGPVKGDSDRLSKIVEKAEAKKKRKKIVNEYQRRKQRKRWNLEDAERAYRRGGN